MQQYMIFPITEKEQEFLQVSPEEFAVEAGGIVGLLLTPSRVREGMRRWVKKGCQNPMNGNEVSDVVRATRDVLLLKHANRVTEIRTAQDKISKGYQSEKNLYEKRIILKNNKTKTLEDTLHTEKEKVLAYQKVYGTGRKHPLNWVQRFVGRLFRIMPRS